MLAVHPLPAQDIILPFEPQAVILWATQQTAEGEVLGARFAYGFSDGTTHYSIAGSTEDDVNPSDPDHRHASKALTFIDNAQVVLAECDVSLDKRKFTVEWTVNNGTAYIIHYLAIGGIDDAKVGVFNGGDTLGDQAVTGVGFKPDIELFISAHVQANPPGSGTAWKMMFGAAISSTQRAVLDLVESPETGLFNGRRTMFTTRCLATITPTSFSEFTIKEADFVSQDSDGFTIDWTKVNTGLDRFGYLALKGQGYEIGIEIEPTSVGEKITNLTFVRNPRGGLFISHQHTDSDGDIAPPASISIGAFQTSARRGAASMSAFDGISPTETSSSTHTDAAFIHIDSGTASLKSEADLVDIDVQAFTLDWTNVNLNPNEFIYIAFGENVPSGWFEPPPMPETPVGVVSY